MTTTPSSEGAAQPDTPGTARLLHLAGEGDRAAFSALYDEVAPGIYGSATALFSDDESAAFATRAVFIALWEQAPHYTADFTLEESDARARDRSAHTWITSLAQSTFSALIRSAQLTAVRPDEHLEQITADIPELQELSEPQRHAVTLTWLGARTHEETAEDLGVALPTMKSRLRDAITRLTHSYVQAITGQVDTSQDPILARPEPAKTPTQLAPGQSATFGTQIAEDLDNGLAYELQALVALNALTEDDHVLVESYVNRQGPEYRQKWNLRVSLLRRAIGWGFRRLRRVPESWIFDDTMEELPEHNVGVAFIDNYDEEAAPSEPSHATQRWILLAVAAVVGVALLLILWNLFFGGSQLSETVADANDVFHTSPQEMQNGGTVQAHISRSEDAAYLSFSSVPELDEDQGYEVWLFTEPGGQASSVGVFSAEELEDDEVEFRGANGYELLWITVEPAGGSEFPTSERLVAIPLNSHTQTAN